MRAMQWNIAAEAISLVILGIIWIYSRKGSHIPSLKNKIFQGCLLVTFSAILTNILSTVMIYYYDFIPLWLTWIVTSVYFVLTPLMGLAYFLYVISVIYTKSQVQKKTILFWLMPGILYAVLIAANPFTKNIFNISMEEGYTRGSLISITYLIFYAYCAASIVITVRSRRRIEPQIYRILSTFPVLAVLVIIVQELFPDIILSGSAATCAMLIICLHLQNRQIFTDYLTNVPNRQELLDMLDLTIDKHLNDDFTLMVVSLREFRQVNNTCGQQKGDEFLKTFCQFLCSMEEGGNVYRFSGDEFAVLFTQESAEEIQKYVKNILSRMEKPWQIGNYQFQLSAVIGIIKQQDAGDTLEHTVNAIEYAVYQAKTGKYGKVCYCDKEMLEKLKRRQQIVEILKEKLADESFEMYYQPIYSVQTGQFLYAESLMRIPESPIGPIYPSEFIPIAEESGMIINITYIILDKVCKFINGLLEESIPLAAVHVNFSAVQFTQPNLAERVLEIINKNGTPASALKIEFTESTLAENAKSVTDFALEMKKNEIMMGLDDFGTGYSNFAMVISIPFSTIKLDRSVICAAMENSTSALAVRNIVRTFNELGMAVVAEGVETEEQRRMVVDCGVDQIQGYYYAKPLPKEEAKEFMKKEANRKTKKEAFSEEE